MMPKRKHDNGDPFLSTMTFADMANCDCDECGPICRLQFNLGDVPKDVESTLQQRLLVKREGGVSIWKMIMPPGADPFTEFGNSHRFLFVWNLPQDSIIKSIGTGTIGSADERNTRKIVKWKEGSVFLKRSNGGKAIGWINEGKDKNKDNAESDVVYYAIKATESSIKSTSAVGTTFGTSDWASSIIHLFQKYLKEETIYELESNDVAYLKDLIIKSDHA